MKHKPNPSLPKYILISFLVFAGALIISIFTRMLLVAAAALVFYPLQLGNQVEDHQNNIEEARFILQYNQAFIQDPNMSHVEQLLEQSMLQKTDEPIITDENRQLFINYLVYLESLAPLILRGVLQLEHVDDLFAYRYFLAVNHPQVQRDQLFVFPDYYRGCFKLYEMWKSYRLTRGEPILQRATALDTWLHYESYIDPSVEIRRASASDNRKEIAGLFHDTDPYIYPAAFGTRKQAVRLLPALMESGPFHTENIRIARLKNRTIGIAVVLDLPAARSMP